MPKLTQLLTYVPKDLKKKAKAKAALEDVSMSGIVCEWLRLWVEDKLPTPTINKNEQDMEE